MGFNTEGFMKKRVILLFVILSCILGGFIYKYLNQSYSALELGITEIKNPHDQDQDGICDSDDLVISAREYLFSGVTYKSAYYAGGYPNDHHGVCTDVIIQALLNSGYDLKTMMDEDIASDPKVYSIDIPDPNIDFRRVNNQRVFFERYAQKLTTELNDPVDFQSGDIIVYDQHIGICSDLRNRDGFPFLLHFLPNGPKENNALSQKKIVGHYRFP